MVLNHIKRSKQIKVTVLVFLLTVSIMLTVPSTISKNIAIVKGTNNSDEELKKEWDKTYGGPGYEAGYWVDNTTDGGYIIVGSNSNKPCRRPVAGDVWLIKTDENGNEMWNKTFGGSKNDSGSCVAQTADRGYIIVGYTTSFGAGKNDIYLIKTDGDGNLQWNKTFGGENEDNGYSVLSTSDGGYLIVGDTFSNSTGYSMKNTTKTTTTPIYELIKTDVWLIKTNSSGDEEWSKTYGGTGVDSGYCVAQTVDGGYIITGGTTSFGAGFMDVLLIKTDSNGNKIWEKTYGGTDWDEGYCVAQTIEGGYIITGTKRFTGTSFYDVLLIKTDSNGNKIWEKTYGETGWDEGHCVVQTVDGGYIIAGYKSMQYFHFQDVWLIKTDKDGNILSDETFGGIGSDFGYCVVQTAKGEYIIAGFTGSYGAGGIDVWLIKVSSGKEKEWFSWSTVLLVLGVIGIAVVLAAFFIKFKRKS